MRRPSSAPGRALADDQTAGRLRLSLDELIDGVMDRLGIKCKLQGVSIQLALEVASGLQDALQD
jgi:hypothetical protein